MNKETKTIKADTQNILQFFKNKPRIKEIINPINIKVAGNTIQRKSKNISYI